MMLSNGGVVSADDAARSPIRLVESRSGGRCARRDPGSPTASASSGCSASTWAAPLPRRASSSTASPTSPRRSRSPACIASRRAPAFPSRSPRSTSSRSVPAVDRSPASTSSVCSRSVPTRRAPSPDRRRTVAAAPIRRSPTPTFCSVCSIPTRSSAVTCRSTPRLAEAAMAPIASAARPRGGRRGRRHPRDRQPEHGRRGSHARRRAGHRPPRHPAARLRRRRTGARLRRCRAPRLVACRVPRQRQRPVGVRHPRLARSHRPRPLDAPSPRRDRSGRA